MAEIKVDINGENISEAVATAIVESSIGAHIKKAVEDVLKERYGSGNIVENAVKSQISISVAKVVAEKYKEEIEGVVADVFESKKKALLGVLSDKLMENFSTALQKAIEGKSY
jgi:hypothetical protein